MRTTHAGAGEGRGSLRACTDQWDWQLRARCRSLGTETFFGTDSETRGARIRRERRARAICGECPVRERCRDHALRVGESHGVWGGTSAPERARLHRKQRRRNGGS
ncbi:WhiB family transcriptional regulator (plasmid) [Rhodococcus pseudokoreensis]|uniref:Transcriptional regulator WhiB n=1 Tax=Rhodococcus pseudokoreensis TaxID=2811421 RepID=A0A974VYG4_9NOCA|nr:WhiB family transcriptional regulator [Rhodococcus pseudokoreensis]QSE87839.1 WhiB family transcriptional regulator [Rhodococcus pseudokoreensis]